MTGRFLRDETGAVLVVVLAFVVLAVPLVTGALGLVSTLSIDSGEKTRNIKSTYATMGGLEHATYRLVYEDGYAESLPLGIPTNYGITINGIDVTVALIKTNEPRLRTPFLRGSPTGPFVSTSRCTPPRCPRTPSPPTPTRPSSAT